MKNKLIAFVDGSYHNKSKTGGWGFVIYENNHILYEKYGQIPSKYHYKFEEYAFIQLLIFLTEKKIETIEVYTDCLDMQKNWLKNPTWLKNFEFFDIKIVFPSNIQLYWISTKKNKADALSRKYLDDLFYQEKKIFENHLKNHQVYGKYKNPKIDYFYLNKLKHANPSRLSFKEKKFITYHSRNSNLLEVVEMNQQIYLRIWNLIQKDYKLNKTILLKKDYFSQMIDIAEELLENNKNFIFALTIKDKTFEKMASLVEFENKQEKNQFNNFINKVDNIILYDKYFLKKTKPIFKKEKNNFFVLKKKILKIKERKLCEKNKKMTVGKMIAWKIREFQNNNKRQPNEIEKNIIIEKTKKEIQEEWFN